MAEQLEKRLIDGHYTKSENIIARCHLLTHRGFLSKTLTKSHDCIAKKCPFFEKLKPEYWEALERSEQEKKINRKMRKQTLKRENDRDMFIRETLQDSGHVYVTSIREESKNRLLITYIYDMRIDLTAEIQVLRKKLKMSIRLQARNGTDEAVESLIRRPRRETRKVTDLRKAPNVGNAVKKRLEALGVFCLEDLFGRNGNDLYELDCEMNNEAVNRRYLTAYHSAVEFAYEIETAKMQKERLNAAG